MSGKQIELSRKLTALLVSVPGVLGSALQVYYLPYFEVNMNALWAVLMNSVVLTAGVMVISDNSQNSTVALVMAVFLCPVVAVLTKEAVRLRWEYICRTYPNNFHQFTSIFQVELAIRPLISQNSPSNRDAIISSFNTATRYFPDSKLLSLWETDYFAYTLQDLRIAMVKITKTHHSNLDLEADFRIFCFEQLLKDKQKRIEELEFLSFWHAFEEAKALDRRSCHLLGAFWSELSSNWPKYAVLSRLAKQISVTLKTCVKKNKEALQNYRSKQALNLLGTLLKEILNDHRGNEYLSRVNHIRPSSDFFSEDSAILVLSCEQSHMGEILYVSTRAKELLKLKNASELMGMEIETCIPKPWAKRHIGYMNRFLLYAAANRVSHSVLHLCTAKGFIVEVNAQIRVSYLNGSAYVLVGFSERERKREVMLLSEEDDKVLGHTEGIPLLLGRPPGLYTGSDLYSLCPGLKLAPVNEQFPYLTVTSQRLYMKLQLLPYGNSHIHCLQVITEEEAAVLLTVHSHTKLDLSSSLSSLELSEPRFQKKVDFQSRLPLPTKSISFADMDDPALGIRPNMELKTSLNSSVATSHALVSAYSKADLSKVKRASNRLQLALLSLLTVVVVVTGTGCGLLQEAVDSLYMANGLQVVLRRGYYSAKIATEVTGGDTEVTDTLKLYSDVFTELQDSKQHWNGVLFDYYTENIVVTWDFWNETCAFHPRTLMDAIQTYIDHGKTYNLQHKPPDFDYIRRNGLSETFQAINYTNSLHLSQNINALEKAELTIELLWWVGEGAVVAVFLAVVLPCIVLIAKVHAQAWRRLLSLKRSTLLKLRNDCHIRLEFQHEKEETKIRPFEPQTSERRIHDFPYQWQGLTLKTGLYVLLAVSFLLLFNHLLCAPIFNLLLKSPKVVKILEDQNTFLQTVKYWTQASILGLNETCPDPVVTSKTELQRQIAALRRNLEETLGLLRTEANADFLMTPQSTQAMLALGIHIAVSLLAIESRYTEKPAFDSLKSSISAVQISLQEGISQYLSDTRSLVDAKVALALGVSVLFAGVSVLLLLCYYIPVIHRFRKQVSEVWKLYRIVPLSELTVPS